jgi:hypothetical protein
MAELEAALDEQSDSIVTRYSKNYVMWLMNDQKKPW